MLGNKTDQKRIDFASDFVGAFTKLGEICASFNDQGEWVSATLNLTADQEGEAPVITMVIFPGTKKDHAVRIQEGLGQFFTGLNKG